MTSRNVRLLSPVGFRQGFRLLNRFFRGYFQGMRSLQFLALSAAFALSFQQIRTWSGGADHTWTGFGGLTAFTDMILSVQPTDSGRFWIAGKRGDSSCTSAPFRTLELWDTMGNVVWRTKLDSAEAMSVRSQVVGTASGGVLAGGGFGGDTLGGLQLERWNSSRTLQWTWKLSGGLPKPYFMLPGVTWLDTLPDGRIAFLGRWRGASWILPNGDTTRISPWPVSPGPNSDSLVGIAGILSPTGDAVWLHPILFDGRLQEDYGFVGLVRGSKFLVAHAVPSGGVLLERFDSSGKALDAGQILTSSGATVTGLAAASDGGVLLSLRSWTDTAVLGDGSRLPLKADSGSVCGKDSVGRNFLLRLDSGLSVRKRLSFAGFHHPQAWRLVSGGGGWVAWAQDDFICSDSIGLVHLDSNLIVTEISSKLGMVFDLKVRGDEIWTTGSPNVYLNGYMIATRLRFGDSAVATGLSQKSRVEGHFELRAREWRYLGNGAATLSISDLSGRLEQRLTAVSGQSISLPRGVHVLQASTADEKWTRRYALP